MKHLSFSILLFVLWLAVVAPQQLDFSSLLPSFLGPAFQQSPQFPHSLSPQKQNPSNLTIDPIVILPGTPGSFLQAKLINDTPPHFFCKRKTADWYLIWVQAKFWLPEIIDCWAHDIQVQYNPLTNTWANTSGVEILPVDFGGFNGTYFQNLTNYFASKAGYQIGKTLFGATFDWRVDGRGATGTGAHQNLKNLIEKAYNTTGRKVHLFGHSGGCQYGLYFLTRFVNQQWKDTYINSFITMGGPWLGAPVASAFMANYSAWPSTSPAYLTNALSKVGSTSALPLIFLPPETYQPEQVIIQTKKRNYTVAESFDMLKDANNSIAYAMRKNNFKDYNNITAPQTTVHCIYSEGFGTPQTFVYSSDDFSHLSSVVNTTGDSVVTTESATFCSSWAAQQKNDVVLKKFNGINHGDMQNSQAIWDYVLNITTH